MNKVYLLFGLLSSVAIFAPDVRADISLPSEKITFVHTLHTHLFSEVYLSPPSFSERQEIKVAQVCWITDTEDCGGADFVGTDLEGGTPEVVPPGGGGGDNSCIEMGFTKTSCPSGYKPNKYCPLNNKYFAECIPDCPSDYKTCEPPLKGVGEVCGNDLYEDCCNPSCSAEYQYSLDEIPSGYETDGEPCKSCDGDLYKIKEKDCTGYLDCGEMGCEDGASTCQSGNTTLCSECEPCPNLGTESECPPCMVCTYEECSNLYIITADYCDCKIGDILYSDRSCSPDVISDKTPIGVVFDEENRLAIALEESRQYWSFPDYFDVPGLSNITSRSAVTADWQGKNNTRVVLEYCKANGKSCPAFEYVNSYKTEGTIAGDWYLPAFGELNAIRGNKDVLNIALGKIGGTKLEPDWYWSSSEHSGNLAWNLSFRGDYVYGYDKNDYSEYVRPVLAF